MESLRFGGFTTLLLGALMFGLLASPAAADVLPAEVDAYRDHFNVSVVAAEERLEVQQEGNKADIVGDLEQRLGKNFGGIWFDNKTGDFVAPVPAGANRAAVGDEFADADLAGDYRAPVVEFSWQELEAAQAQIDHELRRYFEAGLVQTSLDAGTNAVVVNVADGISARSFEQVANESDVAVELRESSKPKFLPEPLGCRAALLEKYCGNPLRGGVEIDTGLGWCTAGFPAVDNVNGRRYLLTAGHCYGGPSNPFNHWSSYDEFVNFVQQSPTEIAQHEHYIGQLNQFTWPTHDWAKIDATGSYWDALPWPTRVVYWGENKSTVINESYPINGETESYKGQVVCHSGATTGTSCATVLAVNYDVYYDENGVWVNDLNVVVGGCVDHGDSGGSVFANNNAVGLLSGGEIDEGDPKVEGDEHPCHEPEWYYTDIKDATKALGVHISANITDPPPPSSWHADNLGGYIYGNPDVSSWGPGRLDVFALGSDGKTMFHKWFNGYEGWSAWEARTSGYSSAPGAVSWGYNRIDTVGRASDGSVAHEYFDGSWHKANIGGYILGEPDVSAWPNRLDVFALGADGKTLFHRWFTVAEGWSGWETRTTGYSSGPSAVSWSSGRIDVVGRATDGSVAHEYWDGTWHKDNLGGYILGKPTISSWGPGRLDVFALGADGKTMFHKWFTAAEGWSGWETRTGGYSSGPGAVSWGYNRLDVVGRATDGSVKHEYWSP